MDVVELGPRLYFLRFPIGHAYLWRDPGGLTLIDTGLPGSAPLIAEAIDGLGLRREDLRNIVLTHFHGDHVGSAAQIASWGEVTVHAHRADAPAVQGEKPGAPPRFLDWELPIWERVRAGLPPEEPAPVRVDRELEDGDVLDFGGGAHVLSVPGHTPGSVAIFLPGPGVLVTGDTVARSQAGDVILGVFNADPERAVVSLERMAELDARIACFGHGEPAVEGAAAELRGALGRLSR